MSPKTEKPHTSIPGPPPLPLVGERGNFLRFFASPFQGLLDLHRRYGDIAGLTAGSSSMVCAFGAEHNRRVLSDDATFLADSQPPFPIPEGSALKRLMQGDMMAKNGDDHRRLRRLVMPAFQKARLLSYCDDIVNSTERWLRGVVPGTTVDISAALLDLMLDVILQCLFGIDASADTDPLGPLAISVLEGYSSPLNIILPFDLPGTPFRKLLRSCEMMEGRLLRLIRERHANAGGRDAFSILVHAHEEDGSRLSDEELVAQSSLIYVAGYETTAMSLTWTLLMLALHPEVLCDVEDEVDAVLRGEPPKIEHIERMPLLDAVIKETARLLPATPILSFRLVGEQVTLGTLTLAKGSKLLLSPLITHRMGDVFPQPTRFLPDRWSRIVPTPFEYMPFGAGPRMCLGAAFASNAARLILPMILQRLRFSLAPDSRVSLQLKGISMAPKNGLRMQVVSRRAPRPRPAPRAPLRGDLGALFDLS